MDTINPKVVRDPIEVEGASVRDMNMYYKGAYAILGGKTLCKVLEIGESNVSVQVISSAGRGADSSRTVPRDRLERFFIPTGVYLLEGGGCFSYNYLQSRTTKRSTAPEFVKTYVLNRHQSINQHKAVAFALFSQDRVGENYKVSDRLAVVDGKIITAYRCMSVGSIKDGAVDSQFPCIVQRMSEGGANV